MGMQRLDPGSHLDPQPFQAGKSHGIPSLLCLSFPRSIQRFPGIGNSGWEEPRAIPSIPFPPFRNPGIAPQFPRDLSKAADGNPGIPSNPTFPKSWECSSPTLFPKPRPPIPLGMSPHPKGGTPAGRGKGKGQTMEVTQIPGDSGIFQKFSGFRAFSTVQGILPCLGSGRAEIPSAGNMENSSRCFFSSRDLFPPHS